MTIEIENDDSESDIESHFEDHKPRLEESSVTVVVSGILTMRADRLVTSPGERILLTQRTEKQDYPWTWECPGGKLTAEESRVFWRHPPAEPCVPISSTKPNDLSAAQREVLVMALRRELHEELGIDVNLTQAQPVRRVIYETRSSKPLHIYFMRVLAYAGRPQPREGQGLGWFRRDQLHENVWTSLNFTPGNALAMDDIKLAAFEQS